MERLVVEAHRHEQIQPIENGKHIAVQRGPGVLVVDAHALPHGLGAGPDVGDTVDCHQTVGAPPRDTEQPSRPVVLEAAG